MRKRTKLSAVLSNEDLVEEREELMVVSPSENRVPLPPHIQTSNTKSKKKKDKRIKLSPEMEDLVEEREDFMVLPSESTRPSSSSEKTHLLRPCFTTSTEETEAMLPPSDIKALSLSVSFNGYRLPHIKFKSWAKKMSFLHEPTWRKAGIYEAVEASTMNIIKDSELVLCIAEKWCPETKTFVFPWGETTITLEDVLVLLGFSVLGSPVFAALDGSGEKIKEKLEEEWVMLKKSQVGTWLTQAAWMRRFMDSGDELEHVAFLVLWLSYFVFPSRYYHMDEAVFSVAVHLSSGTRIALAPAILAHLYSDLTLLKDHTTRSNKYINKIELSALFKLVQVWTWERFRDLRPKPYLLLEGQPRLALWDDVKQGDNDVRQILDNSKMESFEWRPYTNTTTTVKNWELPKFYPEKSMWVPVGPDLDEEFISFARCIKVSELVGMDCVEHYFPNRVASQFGLLQDVPCLVVNRNKLSKEAAWDEYDKPIDDLTLYIPSRSATPRVTPTFCDWWKKWFPKLQQSLKEKCVVESSEILKSRNIISDTSASGSRKRTRRKRVCTMGHCQTHGSDDEDLSLTIAQIKRLSIKKCSGGEDASEPLGEKSRFEAGNNDLGLLQELGSVRADGNETTPPPEIEQRNEDNDETEILVSLSPETRKTCDDELDVHGSNVENKTMNNDGSKDPDCLLNEDGGMAGEKASSEKKEDDNSLIQRKIASNEDNNEPTPCQNLASGGSEVLSESNKNEDVGDETQGHDCLFHDTVPGSEEPMKSIDDSNEKSKQNWKWLAALVEERIAKAERNVAWLKERKAMMMKQRKMQQLV